jgi:YHS domain-containing protein
MKRTLLIIATLALFAGTNNLSGQTNAPAGTAKTPVKPYPLKYCLVSGEKLGEMGKPFTTNYMGQEIKFCCKDCVKDFNKDPDKFLKKLAEEEKKAKK